MPKVGLYRRSLVKKVRPSVRLTGGATAQSFGAGNAAGLIQGGKSMQNAGASMMQDINREKRIEVAEQKQAEKEAKAEAENTENLNAQLTGKSSANAYQDALLELEREYSQRKGSDAIAAYDIYKPKIQELEKKYTQGLSSKELKNFNHYSSYSRNASMRNLLKFDLAARDNYEIQVHTDGITGTTNSMINNRYNFENVNGFADKISEDALDIAIKKNMDKQGQINFIKASLNKAHLQVVDTMMKDGEYNKASDYVAYFENDMLPESVSDINKRIYEEGVRAEAPRLVKEEMAKYPNNPSAQLAAIGKIKDDKLRDLARKEWSIQNKTQEAKVKQEKEIMFKDLLAGALRNSEGTIDTAWNGKSVPIEIRDKVLEARDNIISNHSGNLNYYFDVKEMVENGRIKEITYNTVDFRQLTTDQVEDLYKVKDEKENGSGSSSGQKYVATFNEQAKTEIKAAGLKVDEAEGSKVLSKARNIFEHEKIVKGRDLDYFERQKIIDECIGDEAKGEEGEGFVNEDMTLGEAKKRNLARVFEPDKPDNLVNGSSWNSEIGAYVRPDKSEFGVTIQDGSGRDITPINLEPDTKWNPKISRFIKTTDKVRKIFDKSGELIFDVPIDAKYSEKYSAFTKPGEADDGNGMMKPCVYVYNLKNGQTTIRFRND